MRVIYHVQKDSWFVDAQNPKKKVLKLLFVRKAFYPVRKGQKVYCPFKLITEKSQVFFFNALLCIFSRIYANTWKRGTMCPPRPNRVKCCWKFKEPHVLRSCRTMWLRFERGKWTLVALCAVQCVCRQNGQTLMMSRHFGSQELNNLCILTFSLWEVSRWGLRQTWYLSKILHFQILRLKILLCKST